MATYNSKVRMVLVCIVSKREVSCFYSFMIHEHGGSNIQKKDPVVVLRCPRIVFELSSRADRLICGHSTVGTVRTISVQYEKIGTVKYCTVEY